MADPTKINKTKYTYIWPVPSRPRKEKVSEKQVAYAGLDTKKITKKNPFGHS